MLYHASDSETNIIGNRLPRIEKIRWDDSNGGPVFPKAHGFNSPLPRPSGEPEMFINPILDEDSPDPSVIRMGELYYLVHSNSSQTELIILKSNTLTNFRDAEREVIYRAPEGYRGIRSGKIHIQDGHLYIYFGMRNTTHGHRAFVITADNPTDPMGSWSSPKRLLENVWDGNVIHSSVLKLNDRIYFTWSAESPTNDRWIIYMAPMTNAGEVISPMVLLKQPTEECECLLKCSSDAPTFVYNNGVAYMVFAGGVGNDAGNSLSYMSIEEGRDPLDTSSWALVPGPVFSRNDDEGVYAPINAGFTTSPDGKETWMIYHASDNETHPLQLRTSRIERIEWDPVDGRPIFPKPHGRNHPQPIPTV